MDCLEEQNQELETLRSIFYDGELTELEEGPPAHFQIKVCLDEGAFLPADPKDEDPEFLLDVTYTQEYPNALPEMIIVDPIGLEEDEIFALNEFLNSCATDNIGIAMVFTLVCSAKEHLETMTRDRRERKRLEEEERIRLEEEKEKLRCAGTKVTTESFLEWRAKFFKELAILKAAQITEAQRKAEKEKKNKLTGRQQFEKDKTLAKSDAALMNDGDVAVDLDLFEAEMDDLDLGEDDEENLVLAGFTDDD